MKHPLQVELGKKEKTHIIVEMGRMLERDAEMSWLKQFRPIITTLRSDYFDRRYDTDNYTNLTQEDYLEQLSDSLELIEKLRSICIKSKEKEIEKW